MSGIITKLRLVVVNLLISKVMAGQRDLKPAQHTLIAGAEAPTRISSRLTRSVRLCSTWTLEIYPIFGPFSNLGRRGPARRRTSSAARGDHLHKKEKQKTKKNQKTFSHFSSFSSFLLPPTPTPPPPSPKTTKK